MCAAQPPGGQVSERDALMSEYRDKLITVTRLTQHFQELRLEVQEKNKERQLVERHINSLSCHGQHVGEITRVLEGSRYIFEGDHDDRTVVQARARIDTSKIVVGQRCSLDKQTDTIMHLLPREVDPSVYQMSIEDPGDISYTDIGGLGDQLNEIREIVELPLVNPGIFKRVGVKAPKGALLYGPPGTGKTLIARAVAKNTNAKFLKVVSTSLLTGHYGDSERLVREMFRWARKNAPCIVFIDEIDAIGMKRIGEGHGSDRDTQRILLELLAQMDGFETSDQVKILMATNRPDVLDPALIRPGRLDRKIEIPLPNEQARHEILQIHAKSLNMDDDVDWESIVKLSEGFNGADLRNICTEAGLFTLRADRETVKNEDFLKAVRKLKKTKSMETILHYDKI
jgi:26S proteasome regulatory subunit T4